MKQIFDIESRLNRYPEPGLLKDMFLPATIIMAMVVIAMLSSCSGTKAEKPVPISLSSPEELLNQGTYQYNNNNYIKATQIFEKALLQYRSIDNQTGIAKSCLNLAKSHMAVNNNNIAKSYLDKADAIITGTPLTELSEHLHLLKSSYAINKQAYDAAQLELDAVIVSSNTAVKLAALKNQTRLAFLTHADNRQQWLEQYRSLQNQHPVDTDSHLASIYRFQAELAEADSEKQALLADALSISRRLADRPAIAATLAQSADIDLQTKDYAAAEDKFTRALFIRHQLGDVHNSSILLGRLNTLYKATDSDRQTLTQKWLDKLANGEISEWDSLFSDFDSYPVSR